MAKKKFEVRTTSPAKTNKYYKHVDGGGYNRCIKISGNDVLPNCVGYAYGRFEECAGKKSLSLPVCNAEDWYAKAKALGYKVSKTPKVGAVWVAAKGKVGVNADGAGHVMVVEKVYDDGSILLSSSGYGYKRFYTVSLAKPYKMSGYTFLGFILNPYVEEKVTSKKITYKVDKKYEVTCSSGLNLRKTADVSGKKLAVIPCGTKVTCLKVKGDWIRVTYKGKTGFICCKLGKEIYVE